MNYMSTTTAIYADEYTRGDPASQEHTLFQITIRYK